MKDLGTHIKESLLDIDDSTDIVARLTDSLIGLKKIGRKDIDSIPGVRDIKVFVVPEGVRQIEPETFRGLATKDNNLEVLVLPSTLKLVRRGAFRGLENLKEIRWSGNPSKCIFRASVFAGCDSLEKVEIPEGVIELDENVFLYCQSLKEVTLPASIIEIRPSLFSGCKSLERVDITKLKIEVLPWSIFSHCKSLREIELPKSCRSIGASAFDSCSNLRTVRAPGVKKLYAGCFNECTNLENFDTAEPIITFGWANNYDYGTFRHCRKLRKIKPIVQGIANNAFIGCKSLEEVSWMRGNFRGGGIGDRAFFGCESLKKLHVPVGTSEEWLRKRLESSNVEPEIIYDEKLR